MRTYDDFFGWCDERGLTTDRKIAREFSMSPQTFKCWRLKRSGDDSLPPWVQLACKGYEVVEESRASGLFPNLNQTLEWFSLWRESHGLHSFESTGRVFGISRQAIHNWGARGHLPSWVPLACLGYERSLHDE